MKITLFVAAVAIVAMENQVEAVELIPRHSNGMAQSEAMELAQTKAAFSFKGWQSPDVAGVAMALIGGIFQGFGIADMFMAGRDQKQEIIDAVDTENLQTAANLQEIASMLQAQNEQEAARTAVVADEAKKAVEEAIASDQLAWSNSVAKPSSEPKIQDNIVDLAQTGHEYPHKSEWKGLFDSFLMAQTDDYSSTYLAQSHQDTITDTINAAATAATPSVETPKAATTPVETPKVDTPKDPITDAVKKAAKVVTPKKKKTLTKVKPTAAAAEKKKDEFNPAIPIITVLANVIGTVMGTVSANKVLRLLNKREVKAEMQKAQNAAHPVAESHAQLYSDYAF